MSENTDYKINPEDYEVDLNDKRLTSVTDEGDKAVADLEKTYWGDDGKSGLIGEAQDYYDKLGQNAQDWADKQTALQQERTDFTIQTIEQQKEQAHKDYTKEQSGAYVDWQKQSNEYGANAEAMAAQGLAGSGYSESSQVSMYNTYQNRITAARDSYNQAVLNYNNSIKEAQLANNAALAEIAYQSLQTQLELSLQGFQYKNQLISELSDQKIKTQSYWQGVYQDVLTQLNAEADRELKAATVAEEQRQWQKEYDLAAAESAKNQELLDAQIAQIKVETAAKKAANSKSVGQGSAASIRKNYDKEEKHNAKINQKDEQKTNSTTSATEYLNALIASGASKDKVSNEISIALREGAITKQQAQQLRNTFTPRGLQY